MKAEDVERLEREAADAEAAATAADEHVRALRAERGDAVETDDAERTPPPSYRLLTDESAVAAARGEASGALAAEIEREMREGLAVIDREHAANMKEEAAA